MLMWDDDWDEIPLEPDVPFWPGFVLALVVICCVGFVFFLACAL